MCTRFILHRVSPFFISGNIGHARTLRYYLRCNPGDWGAVSGTNRIYRSDICTYLYTDRNRSFREPKSSFIHQSYFLIIGEFPFFVGQILRAPTLMLFSPKPRRFTAFAVSRGYSLYGGNEPLRSHRDIYDVVEGASPRLPGDDVSPRISLLRQTLRALRNKMISKK